MKVKMFIGGEWVDSSSGETFEDHNPFDGSLFAVVPKGDERDAARAIEAAHRAKDRWADLAPAERIQYLFKLLEVLERRGDEVVEVLVKESGSVVKKAGFEVFFTKGMIQDAIAEAQRKLYDVVIIGSGFGGSVSALRLTEKGYRVGVLESGRRIRTGEFAQSNWDVKRFIWRPRLGLYGIQRLDLLSNVLVLSGAGVGGGSLVYANTLYEPHDAFFTDAQWSGITDWKQELAPFYALSKKMLGVTEANADTPADD